MTAGAASLQPAFTSMKREFQSPSGHLAPEPPSLPRQSWRHCDKPGIEVDAHGDAWLHVVGQGAKAGKVVLPSSVRRALDQHLVQRGCP
jgi:hypothetical protein